MALKTMHKSRATRYDDLYHITTLGPSPTLTRTCSELNTFFVKIEKRDGLLMEALVKV